MNKGTSLEILRQSGRRGLKLFWEAYEQHYDDVYAELMRHLERLPGLAAAVKKMTPAQIEQQNRESRELMRRAIVDDDWDGMLAQQRVQGSTYAMMGVAFGEWFDLIGAFQRVLVPRMIRRHLDQPELLEAALLAMNGYLDVSMTAIAEEYLRTKEKVISQQKLAIEELSTPVLRVRDRLLLLPLIGVVDTHRARHLTEQLLRAVRDHRAKVVVVDITGVPVVDSRVANHLMQTIAAARLMGARTVLTGLSAEVSQALASLGVDLERLSTIGDLQGGLEEAERILGYRMTTAA